MISSFRQYFILLLFTVFIAATLPPSVSAQETVENIGAAPLPEQYLSDFDFKDVYNYSWPMPPLELQDIDSNALTLNDYKGKWRLVNFWATWCPACNIEIPALEKLHETKGGDAFEVVFISLDKPEQHKFLTERKKTVAISPEMRSYYAGKPEIWEDLEIPGVPTSFIIGPDGNIRYKLVGETDWNSKESLAFFDDLINN